MAAPTKQNKSKRDRERALIEKREEKMMRRATRKAEKEGNPRPVGGEDPDLVGIVLGPQPPRPEDEISPVPE
jgi:hypothetical protein